MEIKKLTLHDPAYPSLLREISDPPKELFYLTKADQLVATKTTIAIVGSRKPSNYGRQITAQISSRLAEAGVHIVSGLALGVDALAHQAAVEANSPTIAVLPCGLDRIYPVTHRGLARRILETGGMLVSEYPAGYVPFKHSFIARNRIVSGLSQGVIITEAAEKSGSLHTARFALEQGREVFAIPGNITSPNSAGTNNLIKAGAIPVTRHEDILSSFAISMPSLSERPAAANKEEELILTQLAEGVQDSDMLLKATALTPDTFNRTLTMLELSGKIKALGGGQWRLG